MKRREVDKEMQEREEAEMRQKKAETDQLYHMYQQEKEKQRRQDAQTLSDLHFKQAVSRSKRKKTDFSSSSFRFFQQERREREQAAKQTEIEEVLLDKHMNDVERQQYVDYAGRVIAYMDENGRNTYPLKKVKERFDHQTNVER